MCRARQDCDGIKCCKHAPAALAACLRRLFLSQAEAVVSTTSLSLPVPQRVSLVPVVVDHQKAQNGILSSQRLSSQTYLLCAFPESRKEVRSLYRDCSTLVSTKECF